MTTPSKEGTMSQSKETVGTCDKRQYEHNGPHEEIREHGQRMPPFPCVNWKPLASKLPHPEPPRNKQVPEQTISDECKWCPTEGLPEWSPEAQCWIHRRSSVDKRCLRKTLSPDAEPPSPAGEIASEDDPYVCSFTESGEHAPSPQGDCIYCGSKGRPHKMRRALPKPVPAEGAAEVWIAELFDRESNEWIPNPLLRFERMNQVRAKELAAAFKAAKLDATCRVTRYVPAPEAAAAPDPFVDSEGFCRGIGCGDRCYRPHRESAAPIAPAAQDELIQELVRALKTSLAGKPVVCADELIARAESYRKESEAKNG